MPSHASTAAKVRVKAEYLRRGDIVTSGESVASVSAGVSTPRGKVDVVLERHDGQRRLATWGATTVVTVRRTAQEGGMP